MMMDRTLIASAHAEARERLKQAAIAPLDNKKAKLDVQAVLEAMAQATAAEIQRQELAKREHQQKIDSLTARRDALLSEQRTQQALADKTLAELTANHKAWEDANYAAMQRNDVAEQRRLQGEHGSIEYKLQVIHDGSLHSAMAAAMTAQGVGQEIAALEQSWPKE